MEVKYRIKDHKFYFIFNGILIYLGDIIEMPYTKLNSNDVDLTFTVDIKAPEEIE